MMLQMHLLLCRPDCCQLPLPLSLPLLLHLHRQRGRRGCCQHLLHQAHWQMSQQHLRLPCLQHPQALLLLLHRRWILLLGRGWQTCQNQLRQTL